MVRRIIAVGLVSSLALSVTHSLIAQGAPSSAPPPAAPTAGSSATPFNTVVDDPFYTTNRIDWPGPNRYRSANGAPGPDYWQQRADYVIVAKLDTTARSVTGTVKITYTNNSPDSLRYLWLQLDQNLFNPESQGAHQYGAGSRWGVRNAVGGFQLSAVQANGVVAKYHVDDTRMRVELAKPLAPHGGIVVLSMGYAFLVPDYGADRMARDGALYEIAQWYPRMAVYDDVRGWNTDPYLGQGEFYLEYGDFDVSVTAPAGYTIAATGVLQNPEQVLTAVQRQRLAKAAKSATIVPIITKDEAKAVPVAGTKTWHFVAKNVRDVAWAGAPDFRWDATSWNGVVCQAYYQQGKSSVAWETAAEQTQFTIRTYSELFLPYPYPQATTVAGPVNGMEYPMFVMVGFGANKTDSTAIFGTNDHEFGHEWFPMIVGSNERRYAWQDEGFNTYINTFSLERRYAGTQKALDVYPMYLRNWRQARERGTESPLMTQPDHINPLGLGAIGYRKPAAVMLTLRNHVVGKETFDAAFRAYTRAWAYKHPTPGDFFRFIENYAGADLSWYWRSFWYTTAVLDIGIDSVGQKADQFGSVVVVRLRNVGGVPFPVTLRVKYASGRTADIKYPVAIWARGEEFAEVTVPEPEAVVGVRLWPDPSVPDWDAANDSWGDAPAADPAKPVTF